jgi:Transcriptional Coactivator p15 (PC4)
MTARTKAQSKIEESITIAEWPRNTRGQTNRAQMRTYGGHRLFDLRIWWHGDDDVMHPGKGFSCRVKDLPQVAAAVAEAMERAQALGFLDSDKDAS